MRKRLLVLLMAIGMLVMSAAPAMANHVREDFDKPQKPHQPKPVCSLGLSNNEYSYEGFDRPDQASDPLVGPINKFEHGDPHNTNCEGIG